LIAKKTAQGWEDFKTANPESARNISGAGNIANFLALGYGSGTAAGVAKNTTGKALSATGSAIEKSGVSAGNIAKEKFAQELVMPITSKSTKIEQVGRTTETGFGPFKKSVIAPTKSELKAAQEVMQVEGVSTSNTLQQNYNVIRDAVSKQADDLITQLSANDFIVPKREVMASLKKAADKLKTAPLIVGEAEKTAQKLLAGARRFINENPGTGTGLLKARKSYDKWVLGQKPKAFDAKAENAFTIANREVRNSMNDLLDAKAPNVGVKESLRKQSSLLNALDNLAPKAAKEADTAIGRAANKMFSLVNVESELSKKIVGTGAAIGFLGGVSLSPTLVGAAVGVGATVKLFKALKNPKLREQFGKVLKAVGDKLKPEEKQAMEELLKKR
jgi:hypothetical protein